MSLYFDPQLAFRELAVPERWQNLDDFATWYMSSGTPLMIPWDAEVITSDDATAICLFRKAPYQVELYLVHPGELISEHSHPGVEALVVHLGGGRSGTSTALGVSDRWGTFGGKTFADQTHGGSQFGSFKTGFAILSFQRWPSKTTMTSAAIHWRGVTAGPKQELLIRQHHPHAIAIPGFADVTRGGSEPIL